MKLFVIVTSFFILSIPFTVCGQNINQRSKKNKIYNISIETNQERIKGFLHEVYKDSLIIILSQNTKNVFTVKAQEIKIIKIRRKGRVGRSTWQGAIIGAGTGFVIGLADGDDEPGWFAMTKEEKGISGAFVGGAAGALTGALVGTGSKKFEINYDLKAYWQCLPELRTYTLVNR